ncbi:DUF86 domain-containing protein [Paenibacillus sp. OAS669]|uniref:DUF86 domain-containing protein n=1 Tax=Paenibacillus sp. OAS669 TaxID=2663821 RepID=UPI00178AEE97|nr:HepT-like ribonuclease domain-containing protein [Paenibacillus sp. OAS669]MBE1441172.1 uncharacterized protein YutE (UPF0331/DUF86 family) [Paenibacillus sp. OAS669]
MYYVNHEQINVRLQFLPTLSLACRELTEQWQGEEGKLLLHLAQERVLHLAIETVTDIGSLLIDAFMMRDASSYEDIIEILAGERVFDEATAQVLKRLVQLRRPLVQDFASYPRESLHPLIGELPAVLTAFAEAVPAFISKEMV